MSGHARGELRVLYWNEDGEVKAEHRIGRIYVRGTDAEPEKLYLMDYTFGDGTELTLYFENNHIRIDTKDASKILCGAIMDEQQALLDKLLPTTVDEITP